jgi:hypothetical protein
MYNYKTLTKSQMIELVTLIENSLSTANSEALEASKAYSTDSVSRLAFEVGYLNGSIKNALLLIEDFKKL